MFVETAAPSPAFISGLVPDDVAIPHHDFGALTADNLSRTLLAEVRPAVIVCGAMWAEAYRRQIDELVAIRKSARERFGRAVIAKASWPRVPRNRKEAWNVESFG
jgi:hypothetical protein